MQLKIVFTNQNDGIFQHIRAYSEVGEVENKYITKISEKNSCSPWLK